MDELNRIIGMINRESGDNFRIESQGDEGWEIITLFNGDTQITVDDIAGVIHRLRGIARENGIMLPFPQETTDTLLKEWGEK